nr:right-handed parallel beta-helix repeat-containing protein [Microbacterium hydrocarbonoxydans]
MRKILALAAAAALTAALLGVPTAASAAGTTRYVNPIAGCSNTGPGTTMDAPWCDFVPVAAMDFAAGDELLLARGASWNQQLEISSSGTSAAPITIAAYGSGARPLISRNAEGSDRAVYLENVSHVTVRDIEVANAAVGVQAYYDELDHEGLTIENVYAHHITGIAQGNSQAYDGTCSSSPIPGLYTSAGIAITGPAVNDATGKATVAPFPFTSSDVGLRDLHISGVEVAHSNMGVEIAWCNGIRTHDGTDGANLVQDAVLEDLYLHDLDGGGDTRADCPNGITLINTRNAVVRDSIVQNAGACPSKNGTTGLLLSRNEGLVIVNNLIVQTPDVGTPNDQMGIDLEYANRDVKILYNYIAENHGPGIDILAIRNPATCPGSSNDPFDHSDDTLIDGNLFEDNGEGAVHRVSNCFVPTGTVTNNLYDEPHGLAVSGVGEDFRGFSFLDNHGVGTSIRTSQAARDFTGTAGQHGWKHESRTGTSWTAMTFDAAAQQWNGTFTASGRFARVPATGESVALAWTAPTSGYVNIRGRALSTGAGTPTVRIEKNGVAVVAAQSVPATRVGVATNADSLAVTAGDTIRFITQGLTGTEVSWMPSIGYDAGAPILDQANTFGTFYPYSDLRSTLNRMQTFRPQTAATRVDFWAYRAGSPVGSLELHVYELDSAGQPIATVGHRSVAASGVPTSPGPLSVTTSALDPMKTYGIAASSPATPNGGTTNSYGFEYFDGNPYARGAAWFSTDGGTTWGPDVSSRDIKFATYR